MALLQNIYLGALSIFSHQGKNARKFFLLYIVISQNLWYRNSEITHAGYALDSLYI